MANTATLTTQEKLDLKAKMPTAWTTDKKDWVYLTIPEENALGEKHDTMGLNTHYFEAGQTYLVPKEVYDTITERLKVYARACVRVLQPKRDYDAEAKVDKFGTQRSVKAVDPTVLKD